MVSMPSRDADESIPVWQRRHREWVEHRRTWEFLYDSWEGGERYRQATYGTDQYGLPVYNLVRHKREYPSSFDVGALSRQATSIPGTDPNARAWDDDFQLRRARTPVPDFVEHACECHLSKIFAKEIDRGGPSPLQEWWDDVDGRGTDIGTWMADVIAPLLLVLGQLDLCFDHPRPPDGREILTRADQLEAGLDRVVASYILPQNVLWWEIDDRGHYTEVLVRDPDECGRDRYRHWTEGGRTLYDGDGRILEPATPHPYGRVPIVRVFDRRNPRCGHVGRSRYERIAQIQREFYNRDSELILSDSYQAHPSIQGPECYLNPDSEIPLGPTNVLPMKPIGSMGNESGYQGWECVEFPKAGADSIRLNKADLLDQVDRSALLMKPAGAAGTDGKTVGQSGVSKRLDQSQGNDLLAKIANVLKRAEVTIGRWVLIVAADGGPSQADLDAIKVTYPKAFDLFTTDELAAVAAEVQAILANAGAAPETEAMLIGQIVRLCLPGLDRDEYQEIDDEIEAAIAAKANEASLHREAMGNRLRSGQDASSENPALEPQGVPGGDGPADTSEED